jgi:uncharacterized protein YdcH (DUF465 family)
MEPRGQPRQYIYLLDEILKSLVDEHNQIGGQIKEIVENHQGGESYVERSKTEG